MASDSHCVASLGRYLRPGMRAIDGGANVGRYTAIMAKLVGDGGRVVAVEPDPRASAKIPRAPGVQVVEAVLADVDGATETLYQHPTNSCVNAIRLELAERNGSSVPLRLPTVTLDAIRRTHLGGQVDAIKLDLQGCEAKALRGATAVLAQPGPLWLQLELWPHGLAVLGDTYQGLLDLTRNAGLAPEGQSWEQAARTLRSYEGSETSHLNLVFRR